MLFNRIVY